MVSIKHKVTLKTKTAQEGTPEAVQSPVVTLKRKQLEAAPVAEKPAVALKKKQPKSNTGIIVGGLATAAAILAGVYFLGIKGDDGVVNDGGVPTEQIAQAGETAQPETVQQADATEDATPEEETTVNNESETPAPVEANETPAKANEKQAEKPATTETPAAKPAQPAQSNSSSSTTTKQPIASAPVSGDVVENAKRVIRGDFGNGKERKDKLGSAYAEIQGKVNEMYRQGLVY